MPESPGTHAERLKLIQRVLSYVITEDGSAGRAREALRSLAADLEAVTRERDEARHAYEVLDGIREQCAREMTRAEAAEQRLEATKDALREIAEHRQDRSYNHATAHAYADVRDIARAALAEDK